MSQPNSISELIERLKSNESEAAFLLWDRCIQKLCWEAKRRLRNLPRTATDEEDVALSAFNSFFKAVKEGRFERLDTENDLWQILLMITERKAIGVLRRELAEKRGGGKVRGESVFQNMLGDSSVAGAIAEVGDPSPELVDSFTDNVRDLLETLDDELLQRVAMLRLSRYSNQEIAKELGIALRSVERKVKLIRDKWHASVA